MRGFPKILNSARDVENLKQDFPVELKAYLQDILDYKDQWIVENKLADGDTGITDDTHKVVENKDQLTGEVTDRYQYVFKEDPNCYIFRLGFATTAEAQLFVDSLPSV